MSVGIKRKLKKKKVAVLRKIDEKIFDEYFLKDRNSDSKLKLSERSTREATMPEISADFFEGFKLV